MTLLLTIAILSASPADTLSLQQAQQYAMESYPLRRQLALQDSIALLNVRNLGVNYLPAVSMNAQAVYYSDVAEIRIPSTGAGISQPSNDQYKIGVGVDQLIYDGGLTAQLKSLENIQRDLEKGKVAVELYKLKEQVNVAYFGALIFGAQIENLDLLHADLSARHREVESLVRNGVLLHSNADVLAAELISIEQQRIEVRANRQAAIDVLTELVGRPVFAGTTLLLPVVSARSTRDGMRPEYRVFDASRDVLAQRSHIVSRHRRPKIAAFAETAVGRPPGLDFFETRFKPFFSAGLRVNWSPWTWNKASREREILRLQEELVDAEQRSFSRQIQIKIRRDLAEISKYEDLLERDAAIIGLREDIAAQAASRLASGVITSTDYLIERSAASRASLTRQIHRIQLAQAKVNYQTTIGD